MDQQPCPERQLRHWSILLHSSVDHSIWKDDALDPWMCAIPGANKNQPEIGKTPPLFPCKDRTVMVKHSCRSLFGDSHTSYNTQMPYAGACVFCVNLIFSACLAPSLEENQNKKNAVSHAAMATAEWPLSQSSMFRAW